MLFNLVRSLDILSISADESVLDALKLVGSPTEVRMSV